jgi:hypothetical protein
MENIEPGIVWQILRCGRTWRNQSGHRVHKELSQDSQDAVGVLLKMETIATIFNMKQLRPCIDGKILIEGTHS